MRAYIKTDTDFGADFEQKCADVDNAAVQVLHDVGEIPWNRVGMEQKYGNLDVKAADVAQLQSASDVMSEYLVEQEDYIPKNLRGSERARLMVSERAWKAQQKAKFESGVARHFGVYPHARYRLEGYGTY